MTDKLERPLEVLDLNSLTAMLVEAPSHLLHNYKDELDQADLIEHVRERFRSSRYLTIGEINKACERKTKDLRDIRRAINHLVECEEIKFLEPADGPGRPTERWECRGR